MWYSLFVRQSLAKYFFVEVNEVKVVGLRDMREVPRKSDKKPMNAWLLFYEEPSKDTIGVEAQAQFVDAALLSDALQSVSLAAVDDLIGLDVSMFWNKRGFLEGLVVRPPAAK